MSVIGQRRTAEERGRVLTAMKFIAHLGAANGNASLAAEAFARDHPRSTALELVGKAAVAAGTPDNETAGLIRGETLWDTFLATATQASALGKLAHTTAPFYARVPLVTGVAKARWVGPGQAMPVSAGSVKGVVLTPKKVGAGVISTDELLKATDDKALGVLEALLRAGIVLEEDTALLDPANGGSDATPASITFGAPAIPSTGFTPDAIKADIDAALAVLMAAGVPLASLAFITSTANALALSSMSYPGGVAAFPTVGLAGGTLLGAPLVVSDYAGPQLIALAQDYLVAAEGGFEIETHRYGSVETNDAPVGDASVPTPAQMVSLLQTNSTAVAAVRTADWTMAAPNAVARISGFTPPPAARAAPARKAA